MPCDPGGEFDFDRSGLFCIELAQTHRPVQITFNLKFHELNRLVEGILILLFSLFV